MQIKLRCGEIYDFHRVKSIEDKGNGTLEIIGNFKPRGRYKHVILFKLSIANLDEIMNDYPIKQAAYYCTKCKKSHLSGKIYEEHKEFYENPDDLIPSHTILKADLTKLRKVAKNQLMKLYEKMKNSHRPEVYRKEINKLLIYEGVVEDDLS